MLAVFIMVKVKVKSLSGVRLFATLWTIVHQAPQSMEFSRQEYWSGLPFPSPGDLPDPGIEPRSPALQADTLTSEPPATGRGTGPSESRIGDLASMCKKKKEERTVSFQREERAPTRDRARGPDRPRRDTQDGLSLSPPPDWDSGSWRGVRKSRVRRPRPTRAR